MVTPIYPNTPVHRIRKQSVLWFTTTSRLVLMASAEVILLVGRAYICCATPLTEPRLAFDIDFTAHRVQISTQLGRDGLAAVDMVSSCMRIIDTSFHLCLLPALSLSLSLSLCL